VKTRFWRPIEGEAGGDWGEFDVILLRLKDILK
jgi:hypothetical protein